MERLTVMSARGPLALVPLVVLWSVVVSGMALGVLRVVHVCVCVSAARWIAGTAGWSGGRASMVRLWKRGSASGLVSSI